MLKEFDSEKFKEELIDSEAVLIDVRTDSEYQSGSIPNAILMDCSSPTFVEKINKYDKTKKYLIYCHSGGRSFQVGQYMITQGFKDVAHLENGIISWSGDLV